MTWIVCWDFVSKTYQRAKLVKLTVCVCVSGLCSLWCTAMEDGLGSIRAISVSCQMT